MNKDKLSLLIPSNKAFLSNKNISDRLYVWILLNGVPKYSSTFINSKPMGAYKQIGISYRTYNKRIECLVENDFLEDVGEGYIISKNISEYTRLIYKDTAKKLYNTKIDNIIKVYIYLGSLYSYYKDNVYFSYNSIIDEIGYSSYKNMSNVKKVKEILEKLKELGLIDYIKEYKPKVGDSKEGYLGFRLTKFKKE